MVHSYRMTPLPLFPLPMAACPRELVPLHVFEERYKQMIRFCRDQQEQGGAGEFIIAYFGQQLVAVGTVVRLVKVLRTYDDGRLDVVVVGRRRCRIAEVESGMAYRMARPEPMVDTKEDWNELLATEAFNLHRSLIQVVTGQTPAESRYAGVTELSFLLAATLGLGHGIKQELLELTDEDQRLHLLIREMSTLMHHVEQVQTAARAIQGHWELEKIYGHHPTSRS